MDTIRRINRYIIAGLMMLALVVSGCGMLESDEPIDYRAEGEKPLFKDSPHQSLYQLFGDITENEMKFLIQDILDNLQSATRQGDLTKEDSELIIELIYRGRDAFNELGQGDNDEVASNVRDGLARILELMAEKGVGDLATNLFTGMAADDVQNLITYKDWESVEDPEERARQKAEYDKGNMLIANLLPMLEYIINMDFGNFEGIPLSVPEGVDVDVVIDSDDVHKFTAALGHLVNPDGPYKEVYSQSKALFDMAKVREQSLEKRPTVGDVKNLVNGLLAMLEKVTEQVQDVQGNVDVDTDSIMSALKNAITALVDTYKTEGEITSESVTDTVVDLWFDMRPESDFDIELVLDAVMELWEEEKTAFNDDTLKMIYALGRLMSDTGRTGYDGWNWTNVEDMTDMERVLLCIQDLLNPNVQDRDSLKAFLLSAIEGTTALEGADSIHGILEGLSTVNLDDMKDIDTALYKYMVQHDLYGDPRGEAGTETNMSVLRATVYVLTVLYNISSIDLIEGGVTSSLLDFLLNVEPDADDVPNYPEIPNENIVEWVLALLTAGMYYYPADAEYDYLPGYPNPMEGLDWVYFDQDINVKLGQLPLFTLDKGLSAVFGIFEQYPGILDVLDYATGAITEPLPVFPQFLGNNGTQKSTGVVEKGGHKLMALVGPILKHYFEQDRLLDFVRMATYMNEIDPSTFKTIAWAGDNATFKAGTELGNRLGHILENIEGLYGHGLMYYGFRGDSDADEDHVGDPLDPILDLTVRILKKLANTPYEDGSILDYITALGTGSSVGEEIDPAELISKLFEPNEAGETPIDKLYDFLVENHTSLTVGAQAIGEIILAFHDDFEHYFDDGSITLDEIVKILSEGNVLDVLSAQTGKEEVCEALKSTIRYILNIPEIRNSEIVVAFMKGSGFAHDKTVEMLVGLVDTVFRVIGSGAGDLKVLIPYGYDFVIMANDILRDENLEDEQKVLAILDDAKIKLADPFIQDALTSLIGNALVELDANYGFTDEVFVLKTKMLVKEVLLSSGVLMDDLKEMAPVIIKQLKNVNVQADEIDIDTEELTQGFSKILNTIMDEIGKKSTLTDKLKIMAFKAMWMKHDEYNAGGLSTDQRITDATPLFDALDFLFTGSNRKYDFIPVFEFLDAFVKEDVVSIFVSDESDTKTQASLLRELQEQGAEPMISMRQIKFLFTPYDGRPSIVYMLFDVMHIQRIEGNDNDGYKIETLDVNLLISDFADIIRTINLNADGTSRLYNTLYKLLNFVADNIKIQ